MNEIGMGAADRQGYQRGYDDGLQEGERRGWEKGKEAAAELAQDKLKLGPWIAERIRKLKP